ncbi:MAG: acetate/propionate family kinase [Cyanophyceae cyanobacterium]
MNILVLNAGSSSHKLCLYAIEGALPDNPPPPLWQAQVDWYPDDNSAKLTVEAQAKKRDETITGQSQAQVLSQVLGSLHQGSTAVMNGLEAIALVGHRVVHGGDQYQSSVVVDEEVKGAIADLIPLAPLHNSANLNGIELMESLLGEVPQVAVFDTAFHHTLPDTAATYPGPYEWKAQGIRRYGFHGISHQFCSRRAAQILEQDLSELRLVVCHLGNGASLTAVKNGCSIDTTMGFTPLEGVMMGTRCGSIDPGILMYLLDQGHDLGYLDRLLNRESGLKGLSGVSHDLREVQTAIAQGNQQAKLAFDVYIHRLKSCLGSMIMSLEGLDCLVFTAGLGEHSPEVRSRVCQGLTFLGVELDEEKNGKSPRDQDIATDASTVRVLIIHTQEDWAIAQEAWRCAPASHGNPKNFAINSSSL